MTISICNLSVVPVRAGRASKSEMITQLLFGEMVECWEKKGEWTKIRCTWDNQIGWVQSNQITLITEEEVALYNQESAYCMEISQPVVAIDHFLPITMGATLPNFDGMKFELAGKSYTFSGQVISSGTLAPSTELLIKLARKYLYAPYLKGGRSPFGIDSTGLVQVLFKMMGIAIPRDAYLQARKGELIDFFEQARVGDLVFFEDSKGNIDHAGIICEEGHILHASGQVRIDKIDHFGIFNILTNKYTRKLRVIKRILTDKPPHKDKQKENNLEKVRGQKELFE